MKNFNYKKHRLYESIEFLLQKDINWLLDKLFFMQRFEDIRYKLENKKIKQELKENFINYLLEATPVIKTQNYLQELEEYFELAFEEAKKQFLDKLKNTI